MTWKDACDDPALQDLPYRMELNKWGRLELTPTPPNWHGELISQIGFHLRELCPGGIVAFISAVDTSENTKVADLIWISYERRCASQSEYSYTVAPELCVEIISPADHLAELVPKGQLYLAAGALEFWLCDQLGNMRFFDADGPLDRSRFCPEFPPQIKVHE